MPELNKSMVVATPVGVFKNGPQSGVMDRERFEGIAKRFAEFPRNVPIITGKHTLDLDSAPTVGWVEGLSVNDDGNLIAETRLNGSGIPLVVEDLIRGASIFTVMGANPDGTKQGEVLHHVLLTNNPFIKDFNIAASAHTQGIEPVACFFSALVEKEMPKEKENEKTGAEVEVELRARSEEQEKTIIKLKADGLQQGEQMTTLQEENATLQEQLAHSKSDEVKEAAMVENEVLHRKAFLRDVRTVIEHGLQRGTLLSAEVHGYAGNNPLDLKATERWLKASKFYDESQPDPEKHAFSVIKFMATETKPRVNIGRGFKSGTPESEAFSMSEDDKTLVREQGLNPDIVARMKDDTTYEERNRLKAQVDGK